MMNWQMGAASWRSTSRRGKGKPEAPKVVQGGAEESAEETLSDRALMKALGLFLQVS